MPDVSIIIVNWNTCDLLAACLESILQTTRCLDVETIVVDNASQDGSRLMLQQRFPQVRLLANSENIGFARANNQGARAARGRYLLLLNSDARLLPFAVQHLLQVMEAHPDTGLVGAQLRNPDGSFQCSHTNFPSLRQEFLCLSGLGRLWYGRWYPSHGPEDELGARAVDFVEGACMLIRREAYQAVGGLDEGYFMYSEDVDLCYMLREMGWQVWYQPAAQVLHLGAGRSQSRHAARESDLYCSRVRFFQRRYGERAADLLVTQIYAFTVIKLMVHGLLRLATGGRYGRPVVPLGRLRIDLRLRHL